jgi:hypothetical protein
MNGKRARIAVNHTTEEQSCEIDGQTVSIPPMDGILLPL